MKNQEKDPEDLRALSRARQGTERDGEGRKVFEVVDSTDEEQYWPLGVYLTEAEALAVLDSKEPPYHDSEHDAVTIEVRSRKIGFAPHDYTKIASRTWIYDYAAEDDTAPTWSAKEIKYAARSTKEGGK